MHMIPMKEIGVRYCVAVGVGEGKKERKDWQTTCWSMATHDASWMHPDAGHTFSILCILFTMLPQKHPRQWFFLQLPSCSKKMIRHNCTMLKAACLLSVLQMRVTTEALELSKSESKNRELFGKGFDMILSCVRVKDESGRRIVMPTSNDYRLLKIFAMSLCDTERNKRMFCPGVILQVGSDAIVGHAGAHASIIHAWHCLHMTNSAGT